VTNTLSVKMIKNRLLNSFKPWLNNYPTKFKQNNQFIMKTKNKLIYGLILGGLLSFSADFSFAQTGKAGIKGGLNVSNLYIDNVTDQNARYGFHLGLFGQPIATDAFALQVELLYSTKGNKAQYGSPFDQEIKYNLNYLDLPVLAVIKLGEAAEIHLGGYASYLLGADISYSGSLANGVTKIDKDNLSSVDYGLVGGFALNFGATQVGVRYNYGLAKISNSASANAILGNSKNSNAQLYIAFNLVK